MIYLEECKKHMNNRPIAVVIGKQFLDAEKPIHPL